MEKDLRKRLEEAAKKMLNCNRCLSWVYGECKDKSKCSLYKNTLAGAEFGYKEAIKVAKEWLEKHANGYVDVGSWNGWGDAPFLDKDAIAADFETDMNKLLEE